jgi:hypothetical protein
MHQLYLSRRNLLVLLSKLDRAAKGEATATTIIKCDNQHPLYPQTMPEIMVVAIEDSDYYTDRLPGLMNPKDTPKWPIR